MTCQERHGVPVLGWFLLIGMLSVSESYEYRILSYYVGKTTLWEFCISQHGICCPTHLAPPCEFLAIVHHFCCVALCLLTLGPFAFLLSLLPCSNRLPCLLAFSLSFTCVDNVLLFLSDWYCYLIINFIECTCPQLLCFYCATSLSDYMSDVSNSPVVCFLRWPSFSSTAWRI